MKRVSILGLLVLLSALLGCTTAPEASETTPEVEVEFTSLVSVTGETVPATWATVGAQVRGTVLEVLVEPDDVVKKGDVLLRLDDTDARIAVLKAEARVASAQAELARIVAGTRAEEIAVTEAELRAANSALSETSARLDELESGTIAADIADAQAKLTAAQVDEWSAEDLHKSYGWRMGDESKLQLNAAVSARAAAEAELAAAQKGGEARLHAAESSVWAAAAERDVVKARLEVLKAGPTEEEIAVAKAAVQEAEAALEEAKVMMERTMIRAPFAGTIGVVDVHVGELVVSDQPLITLGDLSTLRVETTDLDEIDVARVAVDQVATVTFDAFPDRLFAGRVTRISPMADPEAGGVHYTVIVTLEELDPALRWGMTAFVDLDVAD
ncbi:MAG: efflux RND transporter periplasmic adaptor subunit [Anaerolineae bacterium]|jgi:HlyD family secretion protein|nr:efflux RND transporter periplasmic adaptor subunit [Anaerolineae bacterium]